MVANRKKLSAQPAKTTAKAPAKKAATAPAKKAVKKAAAKKAAPKKSPAKAAVKKVVKKTATKAPVKKKTPASRPAPKATTKKTARAATEKASSPAPSPVSTASLKGLRGVSGAKAARIAQIVAESFLPKPAPDSKAPAPSPSAAAAAPVETNGALDAAHKAAAVLFSKKAEDVVLMDLRGLSTVADYYLIATCTNEPQMRSILGTVQRALSREGIKALRSEYMTGVRWAVVDYGDLILHLFEKQTRGYYSLERLWADAPSTALKAADYALPGDEDQADADEDGDL